MSKNPYKTESAHSTAQIAVAAIDRRQITTAAIVNCGLFLVPSIIILAIASTFQKMLEEFEVVVPLLSAYVYRMSQYWPLVTGLSIIGVAAALVWYKTLDGKPVYMARRWWYITIAVWISWLGFLVLGVAFPLSSSLIDLA